MNLFGYGIVMLGVCMLGCVVPTRRALNIEPTIAHNHPTIQTCQIIRLSSDTSVVARDAAEGT
jgi:hypothetical protein